MEKCLNLNIKSDFTTFVNSPFSNSIVDDGSTIPGGSCAFSNTYKAFRINDALVSTKGTLNIPIGYLNIGDKIDISMEVMNVTGTKAKLAIDYFTSVDYSSQDANLFILQSEKNGEFEKLGGSFVSMKDLYAKVVIGTFTADIGDFYVRNVEIKVTTSNSNNLKYTQTRRMYNLNGSASGIIVNNAYSDDKCTITVDSTNKQIILTHDKPFTYNKNGISFANVSATYPNYIARTRAESPSSFIIRIYDSANTLIDPATLTTNTSFWVSAVHLGYDSI